ncbi:hypothetical protein ACN27J_28440 [Solwaraspora sp. WMMB762]|uniref:restriction endonuclease subunit S n=1 Tax=Solwaraspora sp. WMMB762 TaxID=3404120 RepID=UPI003B947BFD
MSDLPPGWEWAKLRDIVTRIEAGKSFTCDPRPARNDEWGVIKVSAMTWGEFRESENKAVPAGKDIDPRHEIAPGDLLVSRANTVEYVGAPVLVHSCRPRLLLSDKSLRLVVADEIDRKWLLHALSSPSIRRQVSQRSTGQQESMRNISQQALLDMDIPVPPLAEQRRIVTAVEKELSRLEAGRGYLQGAAARGLPLRRSRLMAFREEVLRAGAVQIPLGELADTSLGKMLDAKRSAGEPSPYLRNINVRWGSVDLTNVERVPLESSERTRFALKPGDLLVCEGGEPGRCAVWRDSREMAYQKALHRVRVSERVLVDWVALMLEESVRNGRINKLLTGTTIKHLPQEKLRTIFIPVPELELQRSAISRFAELDVSLGAIGQSVAYADRRAERLREALLVEAFAGRLVEQDPADEPASELLARIRAQRVVVPKQRGRRTAKELAAPATRAIGTDFQQGELPL